MANLNQSSLDVALRWQFNLENNKNCGPTCQFHKKIKNGGGHVGPTCHYHPLLLFLLSPYLPSLHLSPLLPSPLSRHGREATGGKRRGARWPGAAHGGKGGRYGEGDHDDSGEGGYGGGNHVYGVCGVGGGHRCRAATAKPRPLLPW